MTNNLKEKQALEIYNEIQFHMILKLLDICVANTLLTIFLYHQIRNIGYTALYSGGTFILMFFVLIFWKKFIR